MARKGKRERPAVEWPDGKVPAAIYARVSSAGQDVENSIGGQITECKAEAERNGWVVVREFVDSAKSGRSDRRPDFQELIEMSDRPDCPFALVVVYRFSRFFRNAEESAFHKQHLRKRGIRVVSIRERVDDSAAGKFTESIFEAHDAFQSDLISEDVKRGTRTLARRGFYLASRAPYGMKKVLVQDGGRVRHRLAPDEERAPHVRRLFDLALEEKTERQVRDATNREGVPNASGGRWNSKRVHDVLTNPHYAGAVSWGSLSDDPVLTWDAHQGLVEPWEFERVQDLLRSRAHIRIHPRHAGSPHAFSGLLRCGECGASYTYAPSSRDGRASTHLVCANRKENREACDGPWVRAEQFEPRAMTAILEDVLAEDNVAAAIGELRRESGDGHEKEVSRLEGVDKRLEDLAAREKRLYRAFEGSQIGYEAYAERNGELRQMREAMEAERGRILESAGARTVVLEDPEAVLRYAGELNRFLRTEEPSRCRVWLGGFIRCIWIRRGQGPGERVRATIEYTIPTPPGASAPGTTTRRFALAAGVLPFTRSGPRGRGNLYVVNVTDETYRSIPAWAGQPHQKMRRPRSAGVYPRVGGATVPTPLYTMYGWGLSPRGRGNLDRPLRRSA